MQDIVGLEVKQPSNDKIEVFDSIEQALLV